jgi:hypothetical protein
LFSSISANRHHQSPQQDIARGRGMVDELFQGWGGTGGTQNAIMSSTDYLSQAAKSFNNIEDGFYISPAFLDKITIHVAKNFMDLPKIKVPLILGIWGGKGQVRPAAAAAAAAPAVCVSSCLMCALVLQLMNCSAPLLAFEVTPAH